MNLNKAELIGNLVADPVLRSLPSGQSVASFRVATDYTWRDLKSKKKQKTTDFHSLIAWGKLGDVVGQYLKKGDRVYIDGRLHNRSWAGKDGVKRSTTEIIAQNLIMLGGAKHASSATPEKVNDEVVVEEIDMDKVSVEDKE
ncbi:MAG: single-stranded DNA-binding protein [Patescibacteria group bacterium]|nr:single-stranded DNA-binding protein [Patescibacteria group bacterium]MDD5715891.1 single-stranded DNA-binding protein [Patescibacteria group bacterium]